ncbi:unnamed protein product, partial [Meganyctiphanes norvegica]
MEQHLNNHHPHHRGSLGGGTSTTTLTTPVAAGWQSVPARPTTPTTSTGCGLRSRTNSSSLYQISETAATPDTMEEPAVSLVLPKGHHRGRRASLPVPAITQKRSGSTRKASLAVLLPRHVHGSSESLNSPQSSP